MKVLLTLLVCMGLAELSGAQWHQHNRIDAVSVMDICFADASNGWVVGDMGLIQHTSDGGNSWVSQTCPFPQAWLLSVCFTDPSTGWIAGWDMAGFDSDLILHTSDGGANWTQQQTDVLNGFFCLCFIDENNGWAAGTTFDILHTSNGGSTWTNQQSGTTTILRDIDFVDEWHGWAVGNQGTIIHTSDGGQHWGAQSSGTSYILYGVSFADTLNGWVAGYDFDASGQGIILHTSDGGKTWDQQFNAGYCSLVDIVFTDVSNGWACGDTRIFHTTDGGMNWTEQANVPGASIMALCFNNPPEGWGIGINGEVLHNTDGNSSGEDEERIKPKGFIVMAHPNPCRERAVISYTVPDTGFILMRIIDQQGREVARPVECLQVTGAYSIALNTTLWTPGVYSILLTRGNVITPGKVIVFR